MLQNVSCGTLSVRALSNYKEESIVASKPDPIAFRDIDLEVLAGYCWMDQASVCYSELKISRMLATISRLALDLLS